MKVLKLPLSCSRRGQYQAKCKIQKQPARGSQPEVFLGKGVPKICSKFTGEHPCRCAIEITHLHGCSVNLQRIFVRIPMDGRFFNVFLLPLKAHSQN